MPIIVRNCQKLSKMSNFQNCPKLSTLSKMVKNRQNCQKISKLSTFSKNFRTFSTFLKIVQKCQRKSSWYLSDIQWHVICSKIKSGSVSEWQLSCPQTLSGQLIKDKTKFAPSPFFGNIKIQKAPIPPLPLLKRTSLRREGLKKNVKNGQADRFYLWNFYQLFSTYKTAK